MGSHIQPSILRRLGSALALALTLASCGGGGGDDSDSTDPASGPQITRIGVAGGTAAGPGGSGAAVPAGALTQDVDIGIEASDAGAPPLPADATRIGTTYAFTPHGTSFAQPVTVTVPFDPALLAAGTTPELYKTSAGRVGWEPVAGANVSGSSMVGQVSSFSNFVVAIPPLIKNEPQYEWDFAEYLGNGQGPLILPPGIRTQRGGVLSELADFGPQPLDLEFQTLDQTIPADGRANGYVYAQGNGVTYGTKTQAPFGRVGTAEPVGGKSRLKQAQSFRKVSDDATLTFRLTSVTLHLTDFLGPINRRGELLQAEAMLSVGAFPHSDPSKYFYYRGGRITAWGESGNWDFHANNFSFSRGELWNDERFDATTNTISYPLEQVSCPGEEYQVALEQGRTYTIDLSNVRTGEEFTVRADVETVAVNRKGGRSTEDCQASTAYSELRDPQDIGGTTIEYTGLVPTNTPILDSPPRDAYEPPAVCPGGTVPAAGTLQFSTGFFAVNEAVGSAPSVLVTRTGGSQGAVSATFATLGGTARAGVDYQGVLTTVHFGDGDSGTRVVEVPIIPNSDDEADRTVLLALSEPGGCAALGVPTSAVLTIEDDDPPAQTTFTLGGSVTGLAGSGMLIENIATDPLQISANGAFQFPRVFTTGHVYRIQVTNQPQNPRQACVVTNGEGTVTTVNVSNVQITCTTLPDSGSLDPGFGTGGTAWFSDAGTIPYDTELARQSDGKLLVVNGSNRLRRLLADGTPDPGFGTSGSGSVVVTSGQGISYQVSAVTVQTDGRIVVAGNAPNGALGRPDMLVARYTADGVLDTSFAGGRGIATFDLSTWSDGASQVLVQADGSILLAGVASAPAGGNSNFAVLRLTAAGDIDASYGLAGLASAGDDFFDVPRAAARTVDGGVVLVGRIARSGGALADMGIVKFTAAGVPDPSFGSGGNGLVRPIVDGSHEEARDVAVQPDGKIVVLVTNGSTFTWLARYLADGQVDLTFGSIGRADVSTPMHGWALALQADGSLWVAGAVPGGGGTDYGLMRFTSSGQPDATFNNGAVLSVDLFGGFDDPGAILLQHDGRVVIAGRAYNGSPIGLGLARLLP